MGYICSKCKERQEDQSPSDTSTPDANANANAKGKSPNKKLNAVNYPKLNVDGSSPYMYSDNRENEYNSDEVKLSHMDYENFSSPRFQVKSSNNMLLESLILEDDIHRTDHYINYDYPNNTTVFGRFSNIDDKSFEGEYDQSFDNSFLPTEFTKPNFQDKDYISMSSNSILTDNSVIMQDREDRDNRYDLNVKDISNVLHNKNYYVVYFELNYFMLWNIEYVRSVYPETNLVLIAQINDDPRSIEKIPLLKGEEKSKFVPMLKKDDLHRKCYRMVKFVMNEDMNELNSKPIKLSIEISIYSNNKISTISNEEFFFSSHSDTEMHKYILYSNCYMKFNNKKMGNLNLAFMFKSERLSTVASEAEKKNLEAKYLHMFSKRDRLITFSEDPNLQLSYYNIPNSPINSTIGNSNFMSLGDIEVEIESYLKNESISIDKLIELLTVDNMYKYELYELLKRLHDHLCKKEFNEEKLRLFKEKLNKLLEDIKENKGCFDKITIPFIFNLIKRTFFKVNKVPAGKDKRKIPQEAQKSPRDIEMIITIFYNSFSFINPHLSPEISLSALNYIVKNIEENFQIPTGKDSKISSEDYFINYIINKKKYVDLCDLLMYLSDNPACALPVTMILSKILRTRKDETKDLVNLIKQDRFKEVFKEMLKTHDCNSLIMTNIITILLIIIDQIDIDELFQTVNLQKLKEAFFTFRINGFDIIHDSTINLIKAILIKKSSNVNRQNPATLTLDDRDYREVVLVFTCAINLIRNKFILTTDFVRLVRGLYNQLSHVYNICNIINNINEKNELAAHSVCIERKMPELLIECLHTLNEKKVLTCIDNGLDKFDIVSVNTKMIIFRALYHCILLLQKLRKLDTRSISRNGAEKLYKLFKVIDDNDSIYNPNVIIKNYERLKGKPDDHVKNSLKNLLDYYTRYKQKLPEMVEQIMLILKSN